MTNVMFLIPDKVPSLNILLRKHWAVRRKIKEEWAWQIHAAACKLVENRVFKKIEIVCHRKKLLDYDNFVGGAKECVVDVIKDLGWIKDDDVKNVEVYYVQTQSQPDCTCICLS